MKGYSRSRKDRIDLLAKKYAMEEVLWCLWSGAEATDYKLCNWNSDLLPVLVRKNETRFEYNQYKYTRGYVSCTIFAAIGMLSDLIDYQFSYDQIKEADDLSYDNPDYTPMRKRWKWWYVKLAVKLVADRYNNSELSDIYWKVAYYHISKYDDEILENAIGKLYTIDWNMCPTKKYNEDKQDLMIDGTDFWTETNWHSVDVIQKEGQRSVKDSWSRPEVNVYWLRNKLSAISNYGEDFYIYVKVNDHLEEVKRLNEFKVNLLQTIELNSKMWHQTNDKKYQDQLHQMNESNRKKLKDVDEQLALYHN